MKLTSTQRTDGRRSRERVLMLRGNEVKGFKGIWRLKEANLTLSTAEAEFFLARSKRITHIFSNLGKRDLCSPAFSLSKEVPPSLLKLRSTPFLVSPNW